MNILKKIILSVPTGVLFVSLATVPVQAHDGVSGGTSGSGSSGSSDSSTTTVSESHDSTATETHTTTEVEVSGHATELETAKKIENEQHAKTELSEMEKTGHKKHTDSERKKNCEGLQKGLETKLANLAKNAQKHQTHIDDVLTKAIAYQKEHSVSAADELITAAQTAKTQSEASVMVLQKLTVKIDCSDPNVSQLVANFKASAAQARTDLSAYRQSVKALLTKLESAQEKKES